MEASPISISASHGGMGSFGAGGPSDGVRGRVTALPVASVLPETEGSVGLEGFVLGLVGFEVEGFVGSDSDGSVLSGSEGFVLGVVGEVVEGFVTSSTSSAYPGVGSSTTQPTFSM